MRAKVASKSKTTENRDYSSGVDSGVAVVVAVAHGRAVAHGLVDFPAGEVDAEALAVSFSSAVATLAVANLPALNMFCANQSILR